MKAKFAELNTIPKEKIIERIKELEWRISYFSEMRNNYDSADHSTNAFIEVEVFKAGLVLDELNKLIGIAKKKKVIYKMEEE